MIFQRGGYTTTKEVQNWLVIGDVDDCRWWNITRIYSQHIWEDSGLSSSVHMGISINHCPFVGSVGHRLYLDVCCPFSCTILILDWSQSVEKEPHFQSHSRRVGLREFSGQTSTSIWGLKGQIGFHSKEDSHSSDLGLLGSLLWYVNSWPLLLYDGGRPLGRSLASPFRDHCDEYQEVS